MTFLYNCKHAGDQYQITKFDDDGNVESSYLCTTTECQCPAGQRPICRHREMLPKFIARSFVNTGFMFDYDRGGWVDMRTVEELEGHYSTTGELPEPHSTTVSAPAFVAEDTGSNPVGVANPTATEINQRIVEAKMPDSPIIKELVDRTFEAVAKPYRKPNDGRRV